MKTLLFTSLFALIALLMPSSLKKRVIFFGDSITEAGIKPGGYISRMDSMTAAQGLSDRYELMGSGISGNKVYDLFLRMEDDVLKKEPAIVVIYIGVNDVWHKRTGGTGTDADKFERFYSAIVKKLKEKNILVVLCTPAVIGERTDFSNEQDGDLNKYSNIIRDIAAKNSLPLVDLRKAFLDYNLKNNTANKESGILTTDRVHLNAKGNQLVADEIWKVLQVIQ
ncbi:MAG TPA: GDSL-type esterase/lipase family protein [Ferruginibacter sp.]|nr:GDSL-type esterase/lipase family protein [Ferruginibacter sp.]